MAIRVDPDKLNHNASLISSISSDLLELSKAVQNAANSAPSYNGQFGPKVRTIGNAVFSSGSRCSSVVKSASSDLSARAEKFSDADKVQIFRHTDLFSAQFGRIFEWFKLKMEFETRFFKKLHEIRAEGSIYGKGINLIYANEAFEELLSELLSSEEDAEDVYDSIIRLLQKEIDETVCKPLDRACEEWKKWLKEKQEEVRLAKETEKRKKEIEAYKKKYIPEELWDAWEDCLCPEIGTDGYLIFLQYYYTRVVKDDITILKNGENDYIIFINGSEGLVDENGWLNNPDAYFGRNTKYEQSVLRLIQENIKPPENATLHFVGHSQGGIIANNCVSNAINMGYHVDSVTTFASPPPKGYDQPQSVNCRYYAAEKDPIRVLNRGERDELITIDGSQDVAVAHDRYYSYAKDKTLRHTKSSFQHNGTNFEVVASYDSKLIIDSKSLIV